MEVTEVLAFPLEDASAAGEARRAAAALAGRLGFGEADAGRVALVVTEAASNVVKHGEGGEILVCGERRPGGATIGVVAVDRGPGIADVGASLRDGTSTTGTAGTGLGAIRRLATRFDLYTSPAGTAVVAEIAPAGGGARPDRLVVAGLCVPYPGEAASGDAWVVRPGERGGADVLVVDGLGHGAGAAEAAAEATRLFRAGPRRAPAETLAVLHDGLRATRGAAAAVAALDPERRLVRFAGVGNVCGTIVVDGDARSLVSSHGTLGHTQHRVHEYTYPWPPDALVVLHSDGLSARWDLRAYPGLAVRHPMLVAAVLYRDFRRRTDDAVVVTLRDAA